MCETIAISASADEKTAVGDVVHRRDDSVADQRAHEFAVAALRRKFRTLFRDFEVPTGGVGTFLFGGARLIV